MTTSDEPLSNDPFPIDQTDWEALARYMAGECIPGEQVPLAEWIVADSRRVEQFQKLGQAVKGLRFTPPPDLDVEAARLRTIARRDAHNTTLHRTGRTSAVRIAVAALAFLIVAVTVVAIRRPTRVGVLRALAPQRRFVTSVGQVDSLQLPDGSRVILGPASELVVSKTYGESQRDVILHGEGYFDVHHDDAHPFIVHAGTAQVRDVGTTFIVRQQRDNIVRVAVTSGSVAMHGSSCTDACDVVLERGDRGTLTQTGNHRDHVVAEHGVVTDDDAAWTHGSLVFHDAPLTQVSADVQRWYGIDLRLADSSLATRHLTASFAGDPVDRVIDIIAAAVGADAERNGSTVTLRPRAAGLDSQ